MKKKLLLILFLVVIILGGFIINNYFKKGKIINFPLPAASTIETIQTAPTMDKKEALDILLAQLEPRAGVSMPNPSGESDITKDKLPLDLVFFLPTDITPVEAKMLSYQDESVGYKISFIHQDSTPFTYVYFRSLAAAKYDFLSGGSNDAGLLIVEKDGYIYYISMFYSAPKATEVEITYFKK